MAVTFADEALLFVTLLITGAEVAGADRVIVIELFCPAVFTQVPLSVSVEETYCPLVCSWYVALFPGEGNSPAEKSKVRVHIPTRASITVPLPPPLTMVPPVLINL